MSDSRINLKDRRVIVAVFTVLIAVAAINLRTFGPSLLPTKSSSRAEQTQLPVPGDLDDMTRAAAARLGGGVPGPLTGSIPTDLYGRDPFRTPVERKSAPAPAVRKAAKPRYFCNAILLGGTQPAAIINGHTRHPGDWIGSYCIESIEEKRVVLKAASNRLILTVDGPAVSAPATRPNPAESGRKNQ